MADLSRDELRKLARPGAKARLDELQQEQAAIRREFPDLVTGGGRKAPAGRRKARRRMSAAARRAVSERMTKYWAERRKAKAKVKGK